MDRSDEAASLNGLWQLERKVRALEFAATHNSKSMN